ncbi:MAG: hypothetical protein AAGA85_00105 [Bacteroidota bacterium]
MKKELCLVPALLLFVFFAQAQPGWNWGEQVDAAKEKNALYTDLYKAGKFSDALVPLSWLLENTPDLHVSIYQNGEKIFENLAAKEPDAAKKEEFIQQGLNLFDSRAEYFQKEAYVWNRKATFAYKFYNKDKTKYPYLYETFSKAYELNGDRMTAGNLVAYMNVVYKYRFAGGELTDEGVIDIYSNISDALGAQKEKVSADKQPRYDKMMDQVDKLLTATVDVDCEFVETKLGPKLDQTGDLKLAKKIFQLLLTNKCTDSPLAVQSATIINDVEPDYGVTLFIAKKAAAADDMTTAFEYFDKAIGLTDDNIKKAEVHMDMAKLYAGQQRKIDARSSARKALAFDPSQSDAHLLIGRLYFTSFPDCKGGESKVEDRAVYIAAYDEFRRAGDQKMMEQAQAQFPSIEDIFNENYEEGQSVTVGCWINVSVNIERRPDS